MFQIEDIINDTQSNLFSQVMQNLINSKNDSQLDADIDVYLTDKNNLFKLKAMFIANSKNNKPSNYNSVKKARLVELVITLSCISSKAAEYFSLHEQSNSDLNKDDENLFGLFFKDFYQNNDYLYKLNFLEILVQNIKQKNNFEVIMFLVQKYNLVDYLYKIIDPNQTNISNNIDDISLQLFVDYCIKYIAIISIVLTDVDKNTESMNQTSTEVLKKYEDIINMKDNLNQENNMISIIIGINEMCITNPTKALNVLEKTKYKILRLLNLKIQNATGKIKLEGLRLYASIFNSKQNEQIKINGDLTKMQPSSNNNDIKKKEALSYLESRIEDIYYIFNEKFKIPSYMIQLCKQPIEEYKEVAYSVFKSLCNTTFGSRILMDNNSFVEFILSREHNKTYLDSKYKYQIIECVILNKKEFENMDEKIQDRFRKYHREGAFTSDKTPEVALSNK